MSHHVDLLRQARLLATSERRRPKQASLRRAVSAAYYALFHLLIDEAVHRLVRGDAREVHRDLLRRAFDHGEMRKTCRAFSQPIGGQPQWLKVSGVVVSDDIRFVTETFDTLQRDRHNADYDLSVRLDRLWTLDLVDGVERAFAAWRRARSGADADLFLIALLARRGFERV